MTKIDNRTIIYSWTLFYPSTSQIFLRTRGVHW